MRPEHFVSPLSLYPLPLHACIEKKSVWRDHTVCHDMRLGNASAACAKKNGDSGRREDQAAVEGKVFLSFPVLSFETFHVLLWGVKSLVQGLNAAATAGFEPRTV